MKTRALILAALLTATPAFAVQPDEILPDAALESRARALSQDLRCLVCRNENIDDSDASLARDLRLLLRERLTAGDTDAEAVAYLVDRYGEYVLLNPTTTGTNLILWLAGPGMLAAGAAVAALYLRRRRTAPDPDAPLSATETQRLAEILKD
jgi:cytochrome c-type biogenesis protein CcmH